MATTPSKAPPIRREFLGWDRPALAEAARRLGARYSKGKAFDLGNVIVVTPGKRAGRRLQELLAFLAEDENLLLTPPQIVTEGKLPELLYTPKLPFADEITQDLAWARSLHELPEEQRRHVVPNPPESGNAVAWLHLGRVLRRVHVELAADGIDFSIVQKSGPHVKDFAENERWGALVELQRRYHEILDAQELWDIQTARLTAIRIPEIQTSKDIVLVGTVDLNNALRQMLDLIAANVTAYVVAPESEKDRFDTHGCLVPGTWSNVEIPLRDEQLCQVDGAEEQSTAVIYWLAALNGKYRTDQVAIGVTDELLVPHLQWQMQERGTAGRWVEGAILGEGGPYRLLAAAVKFAGSRRYEDFAALIRHPNVEDWVQNRAAGEITPVGTSLPGQLDVYYNDRLPARIGPGSILQNKKWPDLEFACKLIDKWLGEASSKHRLHEWGGIFRRILGEIYSNRNLNLEEWHDKTLHDMLQTILEACDKLETIPEALDREALLAADAFQIGLGPLAKESFPPPHDPKAVDILGWLELPLDDSEATIITSFNEGFVPKSVNSDAFLPDSLRRQLRIEDNERRYARDAYATTVLCHGRKEFRVVFGRRDTKDDPLQPSRLVFACDSVTMVKRARKFFENRKEASAKRSPRIHQRIEAPGRATFEVPQPVLLATPMQRISVTRFKSYLACPYRYYLRYVRGLESVDDSSRELNGGAFGTLLHATLSAFGREGSTLRHCDRETELFTFLSDTLTTNARRRYGKQSHRAAIRLQIEQARIRLREFAFIQVDQVRQGWRIAYVEDEEEEGKRQGELSVPFSVNGTTIQLVGRIDRIDYHEQSLCVRILDYKTADNAMKPDKTHRKKHNWIDLQLPLYRHLWPTVKMDVAKNCTVKLGYFNLPKAARGAAIEIAPWVDADLADADQAARGVIHDLLNGIFWPPNSPPDYSEEFSAICLDTVLGRPFLIEDMEASQDE